MRVYRWSDAPEIDRMVIVPPSDPLDSSWRLVFHYKDDREPSTIYFSSFTYFQEYFATLMESVGKNQPALI